MSMVKVPASSVLNLVEQSLESNGNPFGLNNKFFSF
jgi:hypothetical protein